jgi:phosphoglycolate phosphatase
VTHVHDWPAAEAELKKAKLLMLDFDGPICSVFSGLPANEVANRLRQHLRNEHPRPLPGLDETGADPFDVLAYAAAHTPQSVASIEAKFTQQECEAVQSATPTTGAHALIAEWSSGGRPLAIVSNNSVASIRKYLSVHGLTDAISFVAARTPQVVDKLKPAPYLLNIVLDMLGIEPQSAIFIGDSRTDMIAGTHAGVVRIAFANRAWKRRELGPFCDFLIENFDH